MSAATQTVAAFACLAMANFGILQAMPVADEPAGK